MSARVMPWRIAPACPVIPPPSNVEFSVELHCAEGLLHDHASGFSAEELGQGPSVD
jgi:hypothetical protein